MQEILLCPTCNEKFHQSYLSTHVELKHLPPKQEEVSQLNCGTCLYTVSSMEKNAMIQHCLTSSHDTKNVTTVWNSYLEMMELRNREIVRIGLEIQRGNMTEDSDVIDQSEVGFRCQSNVKEQVNDTSKLIATAIYKHVSGEEVHNDMESEIEEPKKTISESPEISRESQGIRSFKRRRSTAKAICPDTHKREIFEASPTGAVDTTNNPSQSDSAACSLCDKSIKLAGTKSNLMIKTVSHVTTHIPNLTIFQCGRCDYNTNRRSLVRSHVQKTHGMEHASESRDYTSVATEEDANDIKEKLNECFPNLYSNQLFSRRSVLRYIV